jgi:hypothetical protein
MKEFEVIFIAPTREIIGMRLKQIRFCLYA